MTLGQGQILNQRYRIVRLLGQGGFGAVYKAWDLNMERPRALKENLETNEEAQRQFKREAQILGDLTHPNLPKVIDHFFIPGQGQYLVMEFVEGEDLEEILMKRGAVPEGQALEWIRHVCDALSYLHTQVPPVIHRDIKPANIKINPSGRAMLVDFGIAKTYDPKLKTTVGARAITPGYSPQEQYGLGTTDARTDIYALGATLYHLLTGNEPSESVQRSTDKELIPPRQINAGISASTEAAILKAMELHPSQRFQTAAEFQAALSRPKRAPAAPDRITVAPSANMQAAEMRGPLPNIEALPATPQDFQDRGKAPSPVQPAVSPDRMAATPEETSLPAIRTIAPYPFSYSVTGSLALSISAVSGVICAYSNIYTDGWETASWLMLIWLLLVLYALRLSGRPALRRKVSILAVAAGILLVTAFAIVEGEVRAFLFIPAALCMLLVAIGLIDRTPSLLLQGVGCLIIAVAWAVFLSDGWVDPQKLGIFDAINTIIGMAALIFVLASRPKAPNP